ncbi:MAG: dehalogenase [Chloroflexi bacterium]|nr:dehalogenase [Chloroflexota bacterium]
MWLIIGLVLGSAFGALFWFLNKKNFSLKWYEWLIGIVGIVLLLLTIQNFIGSFAEWEPKAAWAFLLVVGLPALILIAVAGVLAFMRFNKNES